MIRVRSRRTRRLYSIFFLSELVPEAIDRQDIDWQGRVVLDLFAQVHDMDIDSALKPFVVVAEDLLQQLEAAEGAARLADQRLEQLKLFGCKADGRAAQAHAMADKINRQL